MKMKENISISYEDILDLISDISPMARDYVENNYENTTILHAYNSKEGKGVFLKVQSEDLCIYYANFPDDSSLLPLSSINKELSTDSPSDLERCFNVHGRNKGIIELIQSKGYVLDMEGYILRHSDPTPKDIDLGELKVGIFSPNMCEDFVKLFEEAYLKLNQENGWDTKSYSKNSDYYCRQFIKLQEKESKKSFWHQGTLVGCFIVDDNFITDIVVHPNFQGKGYGTLMLKYCISFMREKKDISDIYLRITKSNTGAKQLYERNGFAVISHFSEHTYKG